MAAASPLIREATIDDAEAVATLLAVLGYPCDANEAAERIEAVDDEPDQSLLVAELDGEVCGLIALDLMYYLPLGARSARITALAVGRAQAGQGIGRALLREAELRARHDGAARIEVTSAEQREDAHAFYRACGYTPSSLRFLKRLGAS